MLTMAARGEALSQAVAARATEKSEQEKTLHFPHQIIPESIDGNQLSISGIYERIPKANELITFHQVLLNRGWKLNYI